MKKLKSVIAVVVLLAFAWSLVGCSFLSKPSRRHNGDDDDDVEQSEVEDSEGGQIETDFGTYTIDNGWVEASSQSNPPSMYVYCNEDDVDSSTPPNNLTVSNGTNYYSEDEHEDFCAAILQQIHGQAASYNGTAAMTEYGTFGENMCYRFDMDCEDFDVIQWYVIGDHEYVMFSLTIVDEDEAEDDDCVQMAEDAVYSFVWNR